MTYSVGFRAPTDQELMAGVFGEIIAHADPAARYGDPDLAPAASPGRIDPAVLARARAMLRATLADDRALDDWFGRHVTTPGADLAPDPDEPGPDAAAITAHLDAGGALERSGWSRWAYAEGPPCRLFVNGASIPVDSPELAALLCDGAPLDGAALAPFLGRPATAGLLATLAGMGALEPA
jgi:50S ribosomal protein L16 3-hydroxylase